MTTISFVAAADTTQPGVLTESASTAEDVINVLRLFVSVLTGIDKKLVRQRWLSRPGLTPDIGTDWIAIGIERIDTEGLPYQAGSKAPDVVKRTVWQKIRVAMSFYGPHASENCEKVRDGLHVPQNFAQLTRYGLYFQSVDDAAQHVPDYVHEQWVDRYDIRAAFGRSVTKTFGVRTIVAAGVEIFTEKGKAS